MGNFLAATNMKRCVVNVPDSEIVRFGYLKSDANAYIGTDANSYLQKHHVRQRIQPGRIIKTSGSQVR